jgi:hypothetical protein
MKSSIISCLSIKTIFVKPLKVLGFGYVVQIRSRLKKFPIDSGHKIFVVGRVMKRVCKFL